MNAANLDPEHYEYRVVSAQGVGYPAPTRDPARCFSRLGQLDELRPLRAPHRVQRREVSDWCDAHLEVASAVEAP